MLVLSCLLCRYHPSHSHPSFTIRSGSDHEIRWTQMQHNVLGRGNFVITRSHAMGPTLKRGSGFVSAICKLLVGC
ncbi:hypothetical protein BVRB_006200 [Beta vulgaris subsp. vulgaris]|uniref:Uncharacterized protein n=1 Tax=Beta vulgaris subsp. vulgaris TaxID=3555 RepID=A0A0J8DXP9_BETVV|nr:hypothetical protein BVRB_006200 [Beta vulgaris subsp. vulgaris]